MNGVFRNLLILGIIIFCCIFTYLNIDFFPFTGKFGFIRGLISFNLGYFVWYFSLKRIKIPDIVEYIIPIVLFSLFYALNSFSSNELEKQVLGTFIIPLFFSFSIFLLLKTNGIISNVMNLNIFQQLGKISYSLYLNHYLLVLIIPNLIFKGFNLNHSLITEIIVFITTIFIIIIYSQLTYKYIETKSERLLNFFRKTL